tara:strand:+ start:210 stop:533 length:324 start_codon:yes stop_codon:yes gene_type:complete
LVIKKLYIYLKQLFFLIVLIHINKKGEIMYLKLITIISTIIISAQVFAGSWSYTEPGDILRYNSFNNNWSYESPRSTLRYNSFNNNWSYEPPGSILRYNGFNNSWDW